MRTTWKPFSNKTNLTFLLSLTFFFIFPFVSHSTTFKCEFITEKFKGGKLNEATCSGDPEIAFSTDQYTEKRSEHCKPELPVSYTDFIDYVVDLDKRLITYTEISQYTERGLAYLKQNITEDLKKNKKDYEWYIGDLESVKEHKYSFKILTVQYFNEIVAGESRKSLFITYKKKSKYTSKPSDRFYSLYIPPQGKSIHTGYVSNPFPGKRNSWVNIKFGKCVNTSN